MFQIKVVENITIHSYVRQVHFRKSRSLGANEEKYSRAREATDGNMAHAHCMLRASTHTHNK